MIKFLIMILLILLMLYYFFNTKNLGYILIGFFLLIEVYISFFPVVQFKIYLLIIRLVLLIAGIFFILTAKNQ
ncbi:hypothetical protein [Clostridium thermobutyricum]|uniref:Uncharacterized protein n=1 Tax=Clostridium thermobutyricum DSM 4928 TaxID=1121339 RepID=A0A1V4SVN8_9CLOT|nr:hypothetical protein [Clostridium thermobutyricum]OPX47544.1 hypothetical protein CLTHE_18030 [Clostridium thermobutyricum DSM 4928]